MKVLVSFNANEKQKKIIENLLNGYSEVYYKEDFPNEVDILITLDPKRELGEERLISLRSLKFIQCVYSGVEHLPYELIPENVLIAGNFGAYSVPIAEHIVGMILDLAKRLTANHIKLSRGIYDRNTPNKMLRGKTVGILGFGGIGKETAKLLKPFDVKILAINRTGKTDLEVDFIGTLED
ncbi:MAG: NAD(P)-dependent oxidoreductase, partial [Candidatus Caldipriscus sp.]